jgi:metal-responsive CopG/Arc/MetJ family transcriptional regulator
MPRTVKKENSRKSVLVPVSMVEEIDRIVWEYPEFSYNRQQFIESAIREKIEKIQLLKANNSKNIL